MEVPLPEMDGLQIVAIQVKKLANMTSYMCA